jgi:hypothetical protein
VTRLSWLAGRFAVSAGGLAIARVVVGVFTWAAMISWAVMLASLGNDATEVARQLDAAGVRGAPGDSSDCPIAVYLSVVAGDPVAGSLNVTGKCLIISFSRAWRAPMMLALPWAVRSFMAGFDAGAYPQLVRSELAAGQGRQLVPQAQGAR